MSHLVVGSLLLQGDQRRRGGATLYTKEDKLKVLASYKEHNLYKTCQKFHVNSKNVLRWKKDEEKLLLAREAVGKVNY